MALRPGDRKTQAILAGVIFAGFLLDGTWAVLRERSLARRMIQQRAVTFTELTQGPLVAAYHNFFESAFYRFRDDVLNLMRLEATLDRIQIVDMGGKVRVDSDHLASGPATRAMPVLANEPGDQERLDAVRLLEMTVLPRGRAGDRDEFEVVAPHLESWGRHELSVIYRFRFGPSVDLATRRLLAEHLPSALAAALGTSGVVLALLRRMA